MAWVANPCGASANWRALASGQDKDSCLRHIKTINSDPQSGPHDRPLLVESDGRISSKLPVALSNPGQLPL